MMTRKTHYFKQYAAESATPLGKVVTVSTLVTDPGRDILSLRTLPQYALVLNIHAEGGKYRSLDVPDLAFESGSCILVLPNQAHRYIVTKGRKWEQMYLVFEGEEFDLWADKLSLQNYMPISHGHDVSAMKKMFMEVAETSATSPLTAQTKVLSILAKHVDALRKETGQLEGEKWLAKVYHLLSDTNLSVHEIAAKVSMSYENFRKRFAQIEGVSALAYRKKARAEKAAIHLLSTNETIAHVAEQLGYYDESHFSRQFKEVRGMSPRAYRKQYTKLT
ncbi:AraC family transcriptional regulator [Rubritalea halochordaticola]